MRSLSDCPADLSPALERSLELVKGVAQRERARCADELREMAREVGGSVLLMMAADRLVGG